MEDESKLHKCESDTRYNFICYEWTDGTLNLGVEEYECEVSYCPFCGYKK